MGLSKDHPLLMYFGDLPSDPLTAEQAQGADFETRISSIGKFLLKETRRLHRKLSPEGKASYDPEDILLEIWIELRKCNDSYDSSRGNYRTFAARIIRNVFLEVACRARSVKLPSDTYSQFRKAKPEQVARLTKAAVDHEDVAAILLQDRQPSPIDGLIWMEDVALSNEKLSGILGGFSVIECLALSSLGIWGNETETLRSVGASNGIPQARLRKALKAVRSKLSKSNDQGK